MKIIQALGVDLGNGFVKIVGATNKTVEPSVFAYAPLSMFAHGTDSSIQVNGERLFLGGEAIQSGLPTTHVVGITDAVNRYKSRSYENMLYGFIGKHFKTSVVIENLVLGLPNNHFTESSKILKEKYGNSNATVKIDGKEVKIIIGTVEVLPQPIGSFLREEYVNKNIIIVDLGEGTNDYTHINKMGNINSMFSKTDGLKKYYIDVLRYLQQKYPSYHLELAEVSNYLNQNGIVGLNGEKTPIIDEYTEQLKQQYSRNILQPIIERYDHLNQFDEILITGGGAEAFRDTLEGLQEELINMRIIQNPQLANAEGFFKHAVENIKHE